MFPFLERHYLFYIYDLPLLFYFLSHYMVFHAYRTLHTLHFNHLIPIAYHTYFSIYFHCYIAGLMSPYTKKYKLLYNIF